MRNLFLSHDIIDSNGVTNGKSFSKFLILLAGCVNNAARSTTKTMRKKKRKEIKIQVNQIHKNRKDIRIKKKINAPGLSTTTEEEKKKKKETRKKKKK